jgi:uncharacterized protein
MTEARKSLLFSPLAARVAPFLVFAGLTALQGSFGETGKYWIYVVKTIAALGMLWVVWPVVKEARWSFSVEAIGVGVAIFLIWVFLDPYYAKLDRIFPKLFKAGTTSWNPFEHFGQSSLAWFFVVSRIVGSSIIVPPLEELFYRSFIYRYIIHPNFETVPLKRLHWPAFLAVSAVFGVAHREWFAGILCGAAYQYLTVKHGRLNEAMLAHGVTNLLLACWVVWKGAWQFW